MSSQCPHIELFIESFCERHITFLSQHFFLPKCGKETAAIAEKLDETCSDAEHCHMKRFRRRQRMKENQRKITWHHKRESPPDEDA